MNRIFKYYKNRKGITLVLMAFILAVLLMLAGLAIDIAYMYYVKNQLQVAADAAALAGAAKLDGTDSTDQEDAREKAWEFACKNTAGGSSVYLVKGNNNQPCNQTPDYTELNLANSDTINDDIVVGYWDGSNFSTTIPSGQIANAVRVRARRTEGSPSGPARVFIGQIFRIINADWTFMSARASAIASRPPRANGSIAICTRTCDELSPSPSSPITLYWSPYPSEIDPGNQGIAWTVFSETSQSTPTADLVEYFCGKEKNACDLTVYSSNGYNSSAARQFRCAFKNPLYDSDNKTCADGKCDSNLDTVASWSVLVPVFAPGGCPPGAQPSPYLIVRYAKMRITEVYASGGGGTNRCACGAYDAPAMTGSTPNAIIIDGLQCVACPATEFFGRKPALVR